MPLFGQVTGRFMTAIVDSIDPGNEPDLVPLSGKVSFTLNAARVIDMSSGQPVILAPTVITGVLDDQGYLSTPNANGGTQYQGLWLPANNDPNQNPTETQWSVTYDLQVPGTGRVVSLPTHLLYLPSEATVNLGAFIPPDAAPVMSAAQAEALLALAVRTINGVAPDENGNIVVEGGGGEGGSVTWDNVQDKPTEFFPSPHDHTIPQVTGLEAELLGKATTLAFNALQDEFDDFAEATDLELLTKANQGALDDVSDAVATLSGNLDNTFGIAQAANTAAEAAQATANQAKGKADTALQPADRPYAGLNTVGVGRTIYIAHDAVVPTVPAYTQIVRLPA
ncbi:hypothetical protein PBI_TRISCUIT_31 [Microbacterium phage Triscuit]|nr:hypothetical protein PBI_TRISCUIT_31 [Microbacterium phage Triscuit]